MVVDDHKILLFVCWLSRAGSVEEKRWQFIDYDRYIVRAKDVISIDKESAHEQGAKLIRTNY